MKIRHTPIQDLVIVEPNVFEDDRGYFFESYQSSRLAQSGIDLSFVQDNEAKSSQGVLRGLHYQVGEFAQTKLVRVVTGSVFDVAVDLRPRSNTFGQWFGIKLSGNNKLQLLVPRGFAHGYLVLEDHTIFSYKCDNFYEKEAEGGIKFDDPQLSVEWPVLDCQYLVSEKDQALPFFGQHRPV